MNHILVVPLTSVVLRIVNRNDGKWAQLNNKYGFGFQKDEAKSDRSVMQEAATGYQRGYSDKHVSLRTEN